MQFSDRVDGVSEQLNDRVEGLSEEFSKKLSAQSEDFHRWIGVQGDQFQHKLDLVVEGHNMLSEKLDRVETTLSNKIDAVAADIAAHQADAEAHHRIYRVKEDDEGYAE